MKHFSRKRSFSSGVLNTLLSRVSGLIWKTLQGWRTQDMQLGRLGPSPVLCSSMSSMPTRRVGKQRSTAQLCWTNAWRNDWTKMFASWFHNLPVLCPQARPCTSLSLCFFICKNPSNYRHTSKILPVGSQTTATKQILQNSESSRFCGFPVPTKVMFALYCSPLSVQ